MGFRHHCARSDEWPAWFSFWFSGCWRALAKGAAWAFFSHTHTQSAFQISNFKKKMQIQHHHFLRTFLFGRLLDVCC